MIHSWSTPSSPFLPHQVSIRRTVPACGSRFRLFSSISILVAITMYSMRAFHDDRKTTQWQNRKVSYFFILLPSTFVKSDVGCGDEGSRAAVCFTSPHIASNSKLEAFFYLYGRMTSVWMKESYNPY